MKTLRFWQLRFERFEQIVRELGDSFAAAINVCSATAALSVKWYFYGASIHSMRSEARDRDPRLGERILEGFFVDLLKTAERNLDSDTHDAPNCRCCAVNLPSRPQKRITAAASAGVHND
jgi:hypothetical protein